MKLAPPTEASPYDSIGVPSAPAADASPYDSIGVTSAPAPSGAMPKSDAELSAWVQGEAKRLAGISGPAHDAAIQSAYKVVAGYAKANPKSQLAQKVLQTIHAEAPAHRNFPKS